MSQITKEQAAKVLVGYRTPEKRPTCQSCHFYQERDHPEIGQGWIKICTVLTSVFLGLEFAVSKDGECDRYKKREPL